MARIFNIYFQHEGHAYTALVTIAGKKDNEKVQVTAAEGYLQILMANGRLIFPISEVLHRVTASHSQGSDDSTMHITETISLQLLNTSW